MRAPDIAPSSQRVERIMTASSASQNGRVKAETRDENGRGPAASLWDREREGIVVAR